jgi:L-2-hydroxyglutarate oxidase LhgO
VVVIGAGVVGLAIGRALALRGLQVVILEQANAFGTGTSSRNSEVVHAGLYYPPGSLKARLCVQGRDLMYAYCAERGIGVQRCGKLLVATRDDDLPKLDTIRAHAAACGVHDLQPLTRAQALALEPELHCVAALHSPSSGIVDSHGLMTALLGDAQNAGALFAVASPFVAAARRGSRWQRAHRRRRSLRAGHALAGQRRRTGRAGRGRGAWPASRQPAIPQRHLAKGHYFALARKAPFRHLIYPTPVDGGLGVHLTLDLAGQARFGPDVKWLPAWPAGQPLDYAADPSGRRPSKPRCAATGRACRRARCSRPTPASAPRSAAPGNRRPTSASTARPHMAWPAWCSCSASNRPA